MSTKSNKSPRVSSIDDIAARKAKLEAEMKSLDEQLAAARIATLKEIEGKIQGLPEHFGVATLDDVSNLIAKFKRGILFQDGATKGGEHAARVTLSDEDKQRLLARRREGVQYSKLAEEFGVSAQTAFNYCKAAGLTTPRATAETVTAAAPAQADTPSA